MKVKDSKIMASETISRGHFQSLTTSEVYCYCPLCNLKVVSWKGQTGLKTNLAGHLRYDHNDDGSEVSLTY